MRQLVLASQVRVAWGTSAQAKGRHLDFKHLRGTSPPTERRTYESADSFRHRLA